MASSKSKINILIFFSLRRFAYTGEVNVAQDLLPSLLHTARSFRIKGLDKVENPIDAPPPVSIVNKQLTKTQWNRTFKKVQTKNIVKKLNKLKKL